MKKSKLPKFNPVLKPSASVLKMIQITMKFIEEKSLSDSNFKEEYENYIKENLK